ncbi:hypothetical protein MJI69_31485, partial [Salmonella enterica subsp. enterica serovar Anatum]|nr:hypothetical protein [Salmonella enterica subsp. enterica serovar Anatum]
VALLSFMAGCSNESVSPFVSLISVLAIAYELWQNKSVSRNKIEKKRLFEEGYLAARSGHSRESTLDLTIVPLDSKIPIYDPGRP